jgi:hypothetical protein
MMSGCKMRKINIYNSSQTYILYFDWRNLPVETWKKTSRLGHCLANCQICFIPLKFKSRAVSTCIHTWQISDIIRMLRPYKVSIHPCSALNIFENMTDLSYKLVTTTPLTVMLMSQVILPSCDPFTMKILRKCAQPMEQPSPQWSKTFCHAFPKEARTPPSQSPTTYASITHANHRSMNVQQVLKF